MRGCGVGHRVIVVRASLTLSSFILPNLSLRHFSHKKRLRGQDSQMLLSQRELGIQALRQRRFQRGFPRRTIGPIFFIGRPPRAVEESREHDLLRDNIPRYACAGLLRPTGHWKLQPLGPAFITALHLLCAGLFFIFEIVCRLEIIQSAGRPGLALQIRAKRQISPSGSLIASV